MDIKPGIYTELTSKDYHGHHGSYSKSSLSSFSKFPYQLIWDRAHPKKSDVFDLGTACHTAILELEKWEDSVAIIPQNVLAKNGAKSTNAYKEWEKEQPKDKALITESQRNSVMRVYESVYRNPYHSIAKQYVSGGKSEISVFWEEIFKGNDIDDETGCHHMPSHQYGDPNGCHKLIMKCRPDHYPENLIITDLKTTAVDISDDDAFMRHAYNLKYHWSAALTCRGMTMATGKTHRNYFFVLVQLNPKKPVAPAVRVLKATEEFISLGRLEVMKTMERLAYCDCYDVWPWIPNQVEQLGLPGYILSRMRYSDNL